MSGTNFGELLMHLEATKDSSIILKLLIKVRKHVEWPSNRENINKLSEKGALKIIIGSLHNGKKPIIDVSLSILGNCCLDEKFARIVVRQYNIFSNLNQILKRYPTEDSINGRVFRIIGNICQRGKWENVIVEKKPQLIIHIVNYLKEVALNEEVKASEATIVMGIRSLRELLNSNTIKPLVSIHGALKAIGLVLIKYGTIWVETKENQNILLNIIKLLVQYSRYKYYFSIIEMRNTEKGDAIVVLSKILLISPRQIVKIITNFLKICQLNSDLPIPQIFNALINVLRSEHSIENLGGSYEECIKCLCQLLDHPGNRSNERCGESIPLLIDVFNINSQYNIRDECALLILSTFKKCQYNNSLIQEQINNNIISILIEKLKSIIGPIQLLTIHKNQYKSHKRKTLNYRIRMKKRRLEISAKRQNIEAMDSQSEDEELSALDQMRDWSPGPSTSDSELAMSWTSGLSPRASPQSEVCEFFDSDSDDYSPVCSEADAADLPTDVELPEEGASHEDGGGEPVERLEADSGASMEVRFKLVAKMADLLAVYARIRPVVAQLGSYELLLAMVKAQDYFGCYKENELYFIYDLIRKIIEQHDYLLPLMQTNFLISIDNLTNQTHKSSCSRCYEIQILKNMIIKQMSMVARSKAGAGDIIYKLVRGDMNTKQRLVLSIPFLIRKIELLKKCMLTYNGLNVLVRLLTEESEHKENCIYVLSVLATDRLKISNPRNVSKTHRLQLFRSDKQTLNDPVTFVLDDGNKVIGDRVYLSLQSDYFERLLHGHFKESIQEEIILQNVKYKSMQCLMQLVYSNSVKKLKLEGFFEEDGLEFYDDLETVLDMITLCDRFLMTSFSTHLSDYVENNLFSAKSVPAIYKWSIDSMTNILRVESVAFALVGVMTPTARVEMFNELLQLGCNDEIVDDITELLKRYFSLSR